LIKSLLNTSGGVIDSLLSRETRRFVLLELLFFGRINGLVLGFPRAFGRFASFTPSTLE